MAQFKALFVSTRAEYFRLELAEQLFKRGREIPLVGILAAVTCATLFQTAENKGALTIWAITFIALYAASYLALFLPRRKPNADTYAVWTRNFIWAFASYGVMWGVFTFICLESLGFWQEVALFMILFAIVSVPMPVLAYCLPAAILHPILVLGSASALLIQKSLEPGMNHETSLLVMLLVASVMSTYKQMVMAKNLVSSVDDKRRLSTSVSTIQKMKREKYQDTVTGMLNLEGMVCHMRKARLSGGTGYTLLSLKVDDLEQMYSTHTKAIVDRLVKVVARRIENPGSGALTVAHVGLGEYLILTPEQDVEAEEGTIGDLFQAFNHPYFSGTKQLYLTVSIGATSLCGDEHDESAVISKAVSAMREASKNPGNSFARYDASMSDRFNRWMGIRSQLQHAIKSNEFTVFLQPKVEIETGAVSSAEALIRWQSPTMGIVNPADFIPIAESTGDIMAVGRWVLREAALLVQNPMLPEAFSIAVNVSVKQFADPKLIDLLEEIAQQLKGTQRRIDLEITESALMLESVEVKMMLRDIERLGFGVALDDFGTGYSSLSYLTQLNADTVKLDKSFLDEIPVNTKHAAFVSSVILMAKTLGLKLVAEGVERKDQLDWLALNQCDAVQGYLFSRPLAFPDLLSWLERRTTQSEVNESQLLTVSPT
ncbi:EAL domain-containing protein [Marinobacter sediminum]|uniref:bifunctional diguanylate cyclase/phosphodiesterase n=1 Tax=Marinobacter sediminum TaxID=256323 RepID=UPI00193A3468|nr:bifunctional diguanylate cyclase/phosphodiesterase [Marinobacter sediminum]